MVNYLDYYYHAHRHDLADEPGSQKAPAYFHWRRSMAAIELLDLEQTSLGWTATGWQRDLFPAEYRDEFLVLHDGVDTRRFARSAWHATGRGLRSIAGRVISEETRVISFSARSIDRLRGLDRFMAVANAVLAARADVLCVVVGDPIVKRGLDVDFHNRNYLADLQTRQTPVDPSRLWFLGPVTTSTLSEVFAASDLHIAPSRSYPVARSLLEAMASGCVVLASDTAPHREVITHEKSGLLVDGGDTDEMARRALAVLTDRAEYQPLSGAASLAVREHYSQEVCLPRLAERFSSLVATQGYRS